ncbi:polysaccharide deacetylase family protein [Peribacillus kribbensis]|uniref:polysaccharide deacetylase family protein n=1 Tax=Peribacillus kribbensis TaxID=356658 RepID=UPI0004238443|nr:polysaccharide deacetylase family protein [Peribacillus kribbensis]
MYAEAVFLILAFIILYTLIPFLLSRILGIRALKRNRESSHVAFTFDDGPHPHYTSLLLDLLLEHQVKAAFFVLGSRAEKYPELILRMKKEGHIIGIHNYEHHSNWLTPPWNIYRGIKRSASIIEDITGDKPVYYRPPWGLLSIVDYFMMKEYKIVLWSLMAGDWRAKGGYHRIRNHLLARVKPGDVILLHDSGETFGADEVAPGNTIEALKGVFLELEERGIRWVRIDELHG